MSKTARTHYRTKKTKAKGRASSANSKNNVSDAAGAMNSSEQTVLPSAFSGMSAVEKRSATENTSGCHTRRHSSSAYAG